MSIREGRWICTSCGAENRGPFTSCKGDGTSGCGVARPKGVRFYLPENSPIVTDPGALKDAASGVDWNCDHCGGANKGAFDGHRLLSCVHCGNARDKDDPDEVARYHAQDQVPRTLADTKRFEGEITDPNAPRDRLTGRPVQEPADVPLRKAPEPRGRGLFIAAAVIGALLFVGLLFALFRTSEEQGRVLSGTWNRTIAIERLMTLRESGWTPPHDARILYSETKIRSYSQILSHYQDVQEARTRSVRSGQESYTCGTTDLGNGYFRDETCWRDTYTSETYYVTVKDPVYVPVPNFDSWETYEIDRWREIRDVVATGQDTVLEWPLFTLSGDEREGARSEAFRITYATPSRDKEVLSATLPYEAWKRAMDTETVRVRVNAFNGVMGLAP